MNAPEEIRKFLVGGTDIVTFREMYDRSPEINDFLQSVIDGYLESGAPFVPVPLFYNGKETANNDMEYFRHPERYPGVPYGNAPFGCVRDYLTQEHNMLTTNVRTASGAWKFYTRLYYVFYQYDQTVSMCDEKYERDFCFALDVIPQYLSGGPAEIYIQEHIIPLFPESMPKTQRKKAIKARIREEFKSEKGYPAWAQSSEWPLGKDGKPAVYLGRKKRGGELVQYSFRDESDGSIIVVEQFY